jgi:hypothetical protein
MRFSHLTGPFTLESLTQFLNKAMAGQQSTIPLQEFPRLLAVDEGDAVPSSEGVTAEEEFDLAEIMATEVTAADMDREEQISRVCAVRVTH